VESQAKRESDRAVDNECELSDIDMPARTHDMKSVHTPRGQRARARARDAMSRPGLHYRQIDQNAYRSSRACTEPFGCIERPWQRNEVKYILGKLCLLSAKHKYF
jgi:hypothetical protein